VVRQSTSVRRSLVVCIEAGLALEDAVDRIVIALANVQSELADERILTAAELTRFCGAATGARQLYRTRGGAQRALGRHPAGTEPAL
jgi:hypothetical protein